MKVTQILFSGLGGHGSVVFSIIDGDVKKELDFSLIFYGNQPLFEPYKSYCNTKKIPYETVGFEFKSPLKRMRLIWKILKAQKPDAILLHSIPLIPVAFLYHILFGAKLISIEHQTNSFKTKNEWIISRLLLLFSNKVVYLSDQYKSEITQILSIRHSYFLSKINIINNGIDVNFFTPKSLITLNKRPWHVTYCARFIPLKDFPSFIHAASILVKNNPEQWRFTLAGDGPEMENVRQLIHELNMEPYISLPGMFDQEQLKSLLQDSDIYLHTSQHENMSTSILQAMATKVPVIAANIPGNCNIMSNDLTGILCSPGKANEFAQACQELMDDTVKYQRLAEDAYQNVIKKYSNEKMFNSYKDLIIN
jgi:glycosyltransferase involved in cell wall biosynthesis